MSNFQPIDHKDSDAEYRAAVRQGVEQFVGETLHPLEDAQRLVGRWSVSFPRLPASSSLSAIYEFRADGTFSTSQDAIDAEHPAHWQVERGAVMVQRTWCPPIPEYGIEEGTYDVSLYHCAWLASGRFVLWNGDGSLVQLFTREGA